MSIIKYRDNASSPWQTIDALKGRDAIHVGPSAPTDPEIDMWLDTDEPGQTVVTSVNGMSGAVTIPTAEEGNGYCKMPDGTLIQWGTFTTTSGGSTTSYGSIYILQLSFDFSISFIDTNYVVTGSAKFGTGAALPFGLEGGTTSSASIRVWDIATRTLSSSTPLVVHWQAIGQWK